MLKLSASKIKRDAAASSKVIGYLKNCGIYIVTTWKAYRQQGLTSGILVITTMVGMDVTPNHINKLISRLRMAAINDGKAYAGGSKQNIFIAIEDANHVERNSYRRRKSTPIHLFYKIPYDARLYAIHRI